MAFIKAKNLKHRFVRRDENGEVAAEIAALDGIDLEVEPGQFVAVLGHNGSGKSTFARHLNVLLSPTEGSLWVDGKDVQDENALWEIRQAAGMIFQNPDNQIVAGVVEEDIAFGPENLEFPQMRSGNGWMKACRQWTWKHTACTPQTGCPAARSSGWRWLGWWLCIPNVL